MIFKEIVGLYIVLFITGGKSVIFYHATRTLKKRTVTRIEHFPKNIEHYI